MLEKELQEEKFRWDGPLLLSRPRQGGWRGRAQRNRNKGTRESPALAKGPFKVHKALAAENKELICC